MNWLRAAVELGGKRTIAEVTAARGETDSCPGIRTLSGWLYSSIVKVTTAAKPQPV